MVVVSKVSPDIPKADEVVLRMVSLKDARAVIEDGSSTIWGQLPNIPFKADKFGLGFTTKAQREVIRARIRKPPLRMSNHEANVIEDS